MSTPTDEKTGRVRRRRLLAVAVAALAVGLTVVVLVLAGGRDDGRTTGGTDATGTPSAAVPTDATSEPTPPGPAEPPPPGPAEPPPATPRPTAPTGGADELPPSLPPVPLDRPVTVDDEVAVTLGGIEAVEGRGSGPGNVGGPALRVTIRFDNRTADPLDLSGVAVDLSHGAEQMPAPSLDDASVVPFTGTLQPGETVEGVYVFRVPTESRDTVTVSVGHRPGAPYAVFTGSAA